MKVFLTVLAVLGILGSGVMFLSSPILTAGTWATAAGTCLVALAVLVTSEG